MKKLAVFLLGFALIVIASLTRIDGVCAQSITKPDEKTIADAYIYLLGRVLVIRQEHMDRAAPGFAYSSHKIHSNRLSGLG
jgi:hypothetical protein